MRLPYAIALSVALHVIMVALLSAGPVYADREADAPGKKIPHKRFLVALPVQKPEVEEGQISLPPTVAPLAAAEDRYLGTAEVDQRARPVDVKPLIIPEQA